MSIRKKRKNISDPVTAYAQAVVAGEVIAGPYVRHACARHLQDLESGATRGLVWDISAVQRAIGYFEEVLCLNGGRFEGQPFHVLPWQAFVIGSLFGWKGSDGFRRFRVAYVETAKGSGKSPLAAGIGLYGLTSDGEARAEIYAAATKKDQAQILFRDAVAMVDQSLDLAKRLDKSGSRGKEWNIAHLPSASFFRPISADDGQSGYRPHIALLDEIHEHKTDHVVEMLRAGTKSREQALIFMITNSGTDKRTLCWNYHDYGAKVSAGQLNDDSFFAYICALDESDDPFQDEACWHKANPSLAAGIPGLKYLREQVTQARGMPSKESMVRRLNFCQWVEASSPWISSDVWMGCQDQTSEILTGRRCWGGLDLSSTQDLTAFVLLFEPTPLDPYWRLKPWFWLPGEGLHHKADRDRVPYLAWRDANHLIALPGRAINKLAVLHMLAELSATFHIQEIAYDRWRVEDLKMLIAQESLSLPPLTPFGQGFKDMAPALDEFERLLLNSEMRHDGNPVMTWCAANAVTDTDPAGNRKVTKEKANGRVDGIVAAIMAAGKAMANAEPEQDISEFLNDPLHG
ncbi:MAG: terminase large subunit [Ottowia sp.]|nr:terminase large subunit [Ottowia sp.]